MDQQYLMVFTLRPYQEEAVEAVHNHICTKQTNPCVVLPTGSGKSVVMAETIRRWKEQAPWVRGCILAHRKELVQQNANKLKTISKDEIGVFSAGLGKKDFESSILFASIDSIYKRSGEFQPFDFIFVDEAHRIPPNGEGKYRTFITGCKKFNPNLKTIGWTATPFRMSCGPICHKNHILTDLIYEAGITDLIEQGYLCGLRSKVARSQPELGDVRRYSRGDYITKSLSEATNRNDVIESAIKEASEIIRGEKRKSTVFFCVDVEHCEKVSRCLQRNGIFAPSITGKTKQWKRDKVLADFKSGKLKAICNVNVLTEGFDAPNIDCIVLLRPTLSPGLYSQMVGRGLRVSPGKHDCLVLDMAYCIDEHGPIDLVGKEDKVVEATCEKCRESFSRAIRKCPQCGWEIPKQEIERLENKERERRLHSDKTSGKSILSNEPEIVNVEAVYVSRHCKNGSPDSIRVQYRSGMSMFREWVCLDHEGYAGQKAQQWYKKFVGSDGKVTVNEALSDMFLSQKIAESIKTVTVKRNKKYYEVIDYNKEV